MNVAHILLNWDQQGVDAIVAERSKLSGLGFFSYDVQLNGKKYYIFEKRNITFKQFWLQILTRLSCNETFQVSCSHRDLKSPRRINKYGRPVPDPPSMNARRLVVIPAHSLMRCSHSEILSDSLRQKNLLRVENLIWKVLHYGVL